MSTPALGQWPDIPPRPHEIVGTIRTLATDSGSIAWTQHALDRMEERDISDLDVLHVLRRGDCVGQIEPQKRSGEWKCKIVFPIEHLGGVREVGVVTIVQQATRLLIKTVEWENF